MTETLSIQIDGETRKRLDALAARAHTSPETLAGQAIARYLETETWQLAEIEAGVADIGAGRTVAHEEVVSWLESWGRPNEGKAPE